MNDLTSAESLKKAVVTNGKALLLAKSTFNVSWIRYWDTIQACDNTPGFKLLQKLQTEVHTYVFKYKRGALGVSHAASEMFRLVAVGSADYTEEQCNGFVKWYEKLKVKLDEALSPLFGFHGDGFGDLIDSLPLAGIDIIDRCLTPDKRAGFLEEHEIYQAVEEVHGERWRKFICTGENYIGSELKKQARRWFLHTLLTDHDNVHGWEPGEQAMLTYANYGDD